MGKVQMASSNGSLDSTCTFPTMDDTLKVILDHTATLTVRSEWARVFPDTFLIE